MNPEKLEKVRKLEMRLIDFSVSALAVCDKLPRDYAGLNLRNQLSRSSSAPALIYAEAQVAESRKDFIHKMRLCLKEIKESQTCLHIILKRYGVADNRSVLLKEASELVAIFSASITTVSRSALKK